MANPMTLTMSLDDVVLSGNLPPVVLFAFTRPELLKDVLAAIRLQSLLPPTVIAFVDGARKAEDQPLIDQCIAFLEEFSARSSIPVHIVARTQNLGCDRNVIDGLTEVLSSHDALVYLEDDTVPNPCFYDRMCRLLECYREDERVCSVSAYASLPAELDASINTDFIASNRVFCWGFGTWADQWNAIDLANQSAQYNPFESFYKIPATSQTKLTMINQFWLETDHKTDWVITFTLAALHLGKVHVVPTRSFTFNIGFGHPQSKTYKGKEPAWVNDRYDANVCPSTLPATLDILDALGRSLTTTELVQHLSKHRGLWLKPAAFLYWLKRGQSVDSVASLVRLFISRLPVMMKRWRMGLPI
ncbi:MAG: sugar transferase [Cyanobacteria bacterium P01_E01_bin.6]